MFPRERAAIVRVGAEAAVLVVALCAGVGVFLVHLWVGYAVLEEAINPNVHLHLRPYFPAFLGMGLAAAALVTGGLLGTFSRAPAGLVLVLAVGLLFAGGVPIWKAAVVQSAFPWVGVVLAAATGFWGARYLRLNDRVERALSRGRRGWGLRAVDAGIAIFGLFGMSGVTSVVGGYLRLGVWPPICGIVVFVGAFAVLVWARRV